MTNHVVMRESIVFAVGKKAVLYRPFLVEVRLGVRGQTLLIKGSLKALNCTVGRKTWRG